MKRKFAFIIIIVLASQLFMGVGVQAGDVKYSLTVKVTPPDSHVRIMNIEQKYEPGIVLEPGKYDIYVTRPGYEPERTWVEIKKSATLVSGTSHLTVSITLKKSKGK